ncbi:hypothetical protein ElyMa_002404500 [Elysia marginata]|uniref:Uncharacterized protein n=1 Tax=Elysia marginata TaxID=1093978 RepID=A0AAV4GER3_9GAST|nr:hypothetical protein ElyMa_002404500 [Elysia marginata]
MSPIALRPTARAELTPVTEVDFVSRSDSRGEDTMSPCRWCCLSLEEISNNYTMVETSEPAILERALFSSYRRASFQQ